MCTVNMKLLKMHHSNSKGADYEIDWVLQNKDISKYFYPAAQMMPHFDFCKELLCCCEAFQFAESTKFVPYNTSMN